MTSKPNPATAAGIVAAVVIVTIAAVVIGPQNATAPVKEQVVADPVAVTAEPEVVKSETTVPETTEPEVAEPEIAIVEPKEDEPSLTPTFDLVRVETDGSTVVAGSAEPGATVRIILGEDIVETVKADTSGSFVAMMQLPEGDAPQPMALEQIATTGQIVPSNESVLVLPRVSGVNQPAKVVLADPVGAALLQPEPAAAPSVETESAAVVATTPALDAPQSDEPAPQTFELSLDTISYDQEGDVVLSGRGKSDQFVRVYINNKPVETEAVPSDGQWQVELSNVQEGIHTLRVDEIDAEGAVVSRVESPFKRETPTAAAEAAIASPTKSSVTVQPGHTLWALAQLQYGDGVKYVQIFNANRGAIRDPDLIYPGQVFELPD
ncbi:MAG: LysM peptidoglycan-binding domain-containing protein [Rhodobacteraceae bacterium]|nr:LysM peptidoglycan-binding domain-containing protein [Paracoccaceae bacterium]